jgi:hypothetical protein
MEIVEVQRQPAPPNRPNSRKKRKPGAEFADRHRAGRADLGSNVRSHLAEHMQTGTVDSSVQRHLAHNVNQSVVEHLGDTGGASPTAGTAATVLRRRTSADAAGILHLLRSRQGIRQAILLNEILSRPKSRRR